MESFRFLIVLIFIRASVAVNDVNLKLWNAAYSGNKTAVVSTLSAGGDPSWQNPSEHDRTALIKAAIRNHADITRILLEAGADIEKENDHSQTAMQEAAWRGNTETITVLINHKADVNSLDQYGATPLIRTAQKGHLAATMELINAGANVTIAENNGDTALHNAIYSNSTQIARLLLQKGANANKRNNKGQTPADLARDKGYRQLADTIDNFTPVTNTTTTVSLTETTATVALSETTATVALTETTTTVSLTEATTTVALTAPTGQPTTPTFMSQYGLITIAAVCGTVIASFVCIFLVVRYRLSLRHDQGHNEDAQPQDSRVICKGPGACSLCERCE
ncbi:unnamed protein product [Meganyctiphanes norvegica]|uniref:Ankyrin repeat protein n=1 Tax=Meganyctiphanes norvegica TaxID=48144 RepID=A0AAV2STW0_MEGNR